MNSCFQQYKSCECSPLLIFLRYFPLLDAFFLFFRECQESWRKSQTCTLIYHVIVVVCVVDCWANRQDAPF